jgi:feruloyl-CoA synthase
LSIVGSLFSSPSVTADRRGDGSILLRSTRPLLPFPRSVGDVLARHAAERPHRIFLGERSGDGWNCMTFAQAFRAVRALATYLLSRGLTKETPIAILSEASLDHAVVSLAGLYAGIPVAPISPAYSTQFGDLGRLTTVLRALGPKLVFAADADVYRDALASIEPDVPILYTRGSVDGRDARTLNEAISGEPTADVDAAHETVTPDSVAKILFTSGSTSEPKGVINTHRMLCSNQQSLVQIWPFLAEGELVLVDWLPWHHTFGGNHNFNMALFHGGSLYIDDGRPMPGRFERSIGALAEHPPTAYFNVPRGHKLLVDALNADEGFAKIFFSRLRLIGNAAAALPRTTWAAIRELSERYGNGVVPVTGSWGLTETSPMATAVHYPLLDSADIGLPGPGTELLFVPADNKLEVRIRGPLVTPGYWRRSDLSAAAFDDEGFFRTGDAVRFADPSDPAKGLLFDGRLAENFKLTSGTWVDAGAVRLGVIAAASPPIDDVVVAGEGRDEIGLLLFVSAATREKYADDAALRVAVGELLRAYNATAGGSSHRAARALIESEPLSPSAGEITDKGSLNQRRVLQRRAESVARVFADRPDSDVLILSP